MIEKEMTLDQEFSQTQVIESPYDARDYQIIASQNFPKTFELPKKVNIKYQGMKSTCVAYAISPLVEYHNLYE